MFLGFLRTQLPHFHETLVTAQVMEARAKLAQWFTTYMRVVFWAIHPHDNLTALLTFEDVFADWIFSTSFVLVFVEALRTFECQTTIPARNSSQVSAVNAEATSTFVGTRMSEPLLVAFVTAVTPVGLLIPCWQTGEKLKMSIMMKNQNFIIPLRAAVNDRICVINGDNFDLMIWQNLELNEYTEWATWLREFPYSLKFRYIIEGIFAFLRQPSFHNQCNRSCLQPLLALVQHFVRLVLVSIKLPKSERCGKTQPILNIDLRAKR